MKKRILSMLLVIVMVLSMVPVSALAEGEVKITGTNYMAIDGKVTLTLTGAVATDTIVWESNAATVATVSYAETNPTECEVTGVGQGKTEIVATVNGVEKSYAVAVYQMSYAKPVVDADAVVDLNGGVKTLSYTVEAGTETQKVVRWKSSNTKVATISWKGELTPVAAGHTEISVFYNGQWSDPKDIEIKDMTVNLNNFTLSKKSLSLTVGKSKTITATFDPTDATDTTLTWISSDTDVATVDAGVITGVAPGTATITAKHGDIEKTVAVTVTEAPVPVESVTITGGQSSLLRGETMELSATVLPENASDKTVTWSISPATVGTVADGKVELYETGSETSATVTATCGGVSGTFTFNITDPVGVTSVTISQKDGLKEVAVGGKLKLIAAVQPDNATDQTVTWTSSDTSIAKVTQKGAVSGVAEGTATITATCGGVSGTYEVTVIPTTNIATDIPTTILAGKALDLDASCVDASGEPVPNTSVEWTLLTEEEGVTLTGSKLETRSDMQYQHEIKLRAEAVGCDAKAVEVTVEVMPVTTGITLKVGEDKVNNKTYVVDLSDATIMSSGVIISAGVQPKSAEQTVRWEITDSKNICTEVQGKLDLKLTPVSGQKSGTVTVKAYAGDGSEEYATTTIQFSVLGAGKLKDVPEKLRGGASLNMKSFLNLDKNLDDKTVTWSIQNNVLNGKKIASISADGRLTTKPVTAPHTIKVRVTGSSGGYDEKEITLYPAAKSVKITCDELKAQNYTVELSKEKSERTFDFEATIKPDVLQDEDVWPLIWSSTNNDIATVDEDGQVVVKKSGKVRIDCMIADGSKVTGSVNLKVTSTANEVTVTPSGRTLASGNSLNMKAVIKTPTGRKAANQEVIWSIADEFGNATNAAIVSPTGRVTAYDVDQNTVVVVTATSKQDKTVSGSVLLTIKPNTTKTLHAIIAGDMISGSYAMNKGESVVVDAQWQRSGNGVVKDAEDCQFLSSNTNVATIDKDVGTLKAVGYGSSTITLRCVDPATQNICTSTFTVKVVKKVGTVTITAPSLKDLRSGKSVSLSATAWNDYANGTKADNQGFTWEVTENGKETDVATINSNGVLTAKGVTKKHTVVVKAISKESGIFAKATFHIFPAETVKFYFALNDQEYTGTLPVDLDTGLGGLKVRIHTAFANGNGNITESNINPAGVTWSTSDKNVIQITTAGPKALKVGKATLTAKYKIGTTTYESKITAIVNRAMGSVRSIELSSILVAGKSINLRAVPANSNATNKNVLWSVEPGSYSDNVSINMYTGKLSAKKGIGGYTVTVKATPVDGSTPMSTNVYVFAATTKVEISDGTDVVNGNKVYVALADKTAQFYAVAEPTEAYQTSFKWSSSDTSVATVSGDGKVTIKKVGATTIKAIAQDGTGKYAKFTLRVTN